jgi:hypothetical protein
MSAVPRAPCNILDYARNSSSLCNVPQRRHLQPFTAALSGIRSVPCTLLEAKLRVYPLAEKQEGRRRNYLNSPNRSGFWLPSQATSRAVSGCTSLSVCYLSRWTELRLQHTHNGLYWLSNTPSHGTTLGRASNQHLPHIAALTGPG